MAEPFQVNRYEIHLKVWPLHRKVERTIEVAHGSKKRSVITDNRACLCRTVYFSKDKQPNLPYTLRYGTRGGGFVFPARMTMVKGKKGAALAVENHATPDHLCRYEDYGTEVVETFLPQSSHAYTMEFEILKGFDADARNVHFHLPRAAVYQEVLVHLDLSAYAMSGFTMKPSPSLYFHSKDSGGHEFCTMRGVGSLIQHVKSEPSGIWSWQLTSKEEGVIDLLWDLQPPESWIPLAQGNEGIERLGSMTHLAIPNLRYFHALGKKIKQMETQGKTFSLRKTASETILSKEGVKKIVHAMYEFFRRYFESYGFPPVCPKPFIVNPVDSDAPESSKLFHLVDHIPFRICNPIGWGAWKLTDDYIKSQGFDEIRI